MRLLAHALLITLGLTGGVAAAAPNSSSPPGYRIVERIPIGDAGWDYVQFEPVHRRLFIARDTGVSMLEVDRHRLETRLVAGVDNRAVVALPGGDTVLTTLAGASSVIVFAAADGRVTGTVPLRQAPDAAVYEPRAGHVWAIGSAGEITEIDPLARNAVATLDLGDALEFAVADGQGRIFVNSPPTASVIAVDAIARRVVGRWKMPGCRDPTGLAYSEAADVLLSVCANRRVKVLDARVGTDTATVAVGARADAVIYDAATRRAFVPSAADGLLTVLEVRGPRDVRVLEQVSTQAGTRTGALDPSTGTLYLPAGRFGPPKAGGGADLLPGTVELLVLRPR